MDAVLLDTDVFSFFFRQDSRHKLYVNDIQGREVCLSFQSVAELLRWAVERNWGDNRRRSLEQVMRRCVILPFDATMAQHWATIAATRKRAGTPIACGDAWIAASALSYDIPLVSHNGSHFQGIAPLKVICHAPGFE